MREIICKKLKLLACGFVASVLLLAAFASFAAPNDLVEQEAAWRKVRLVANKRLAALGWMEDYEAAKAKAVAEKKKILMAFVWDRCGFCTALEREVLFQPRFVSRASESCVLLFVDISESVNQSLKGSKLVTWASELAEKFNVRGCPTLWVSDASGRKIACAGSYEKGGPSIYLDWLDCAVAPDDIDTAESEKPDNGEIRVVSGRHCGKNCKDCCKYFICRCCRKNKGRCCPNNGAKPGYFDDAQKRNHEIGAKGNEAQSDAIVGGAALNRVRCGKDCCKNKICSCCKKNNGKCCPDNGAPEGSFVDSSADAVKVDEPATNALVDVKEESTFELVRLVNDYELRIEDASLSADLDRLAKFFKKVSDAFNRETGGYYAGQKHHYAGIILHADSARRGEKSKFIGSRNFYSMYLPDNMEDKSWCYFLCDSFLSRTKGHSNKEMQMRDQMLVYVGYRVAAAIGLEGAAAVLAGIGEEKKGVRRLMHELTNIKEDAVSEYYRAKVRLAETERIGLVVSVHDVAEIFSGVVGRDVFALFVKFGLNAQKKKVSPRLAGFSAEKGTSSIVGEGVRQ